jgi:hypothetical protein
MPATNHLSYGTAIHGLDSLQKHKPSSSSLSSLGVTALVSLGLLYNQSPLLRLVVRFLNNTFLWDEVVSPMSNSQSGGPVCLS